MNKTERQQKILDYMLCNNKAATAEELKEICCVTSETIRKDLIEMEQQKKICRVLGGAVLYERSDERLLQNRYYENLKAKREIAAAAVKLLHDRDFVCLDSGSTNLCFSMHFPDVAISVLTNSLNIAQELSQRTNVRVFVAGGELRGKNMSMTGFATENMVQNYRVRKVFLTSEGVDPDYGVMDAHESESCVKRAMLSIAREAYLLADHSKFSVITPICTASVDKLTAIITDSEIDPKIVKTYQDAGVRVIVAEPIK